MGIQSSSVTLVNEKRSGRPRVERIDKDILVDFFCEDEAESQGGCYYRRNDISCCIMVVTIE